MPAGPDWRRWDTCLRAGNLLGGAAAWTVQVPAHAAHADESQAEHEEGIAGFRDRGSSGPGFHEGEIVDGGECRFRVAATDRNAKAGDRRTCGMNPQKSVGPPMERVNVSVVASARVTLTEMSPGRTVKLMSEANMLPPTPESPSR